MVPGSSRTKMIDYLHQAPSKGDTMFKTARENLYWPTMNNNLLVKSRECFHCKEEDPQQSDGKPNENTPDLSKLDPFIIFMLTCFAW